MPVFMQAQHTAGYVGREGPLELCSLCPAKNCAKGRSKEALQINRDLDRSATKETLAWQEYQGSDYQALPTPVGP